MAYGAALSTLIALIVAGLSYQAFYYVYFEDNFPSSTVFKLLGFIALLIIGGYLLKNILLNWIVSFLLFVIGSILVSFVLKLLSVKKIKDMLKMA